MCSGIKRFLTAALAAVMGALTLSFPAAAAAWETDLSDYNGDGVIDVFDFILHKRTIIAENAPIDFSLSDAVAAPGGLATVSGVIGSNSGYSHAKFLLKYPEGFKPEAPEGMEKPLLCNEALFPEVEFAVNVFSQQNQVLCMYSDDVYTEENGVLFDLSFRVPEDAVPGTTYQIDFHDIVFTLDGEAMPVLTKRGTITVVPEAELPDPPVTEATTTTATTTSTAPVTTTTTTVTTTGTTTTTTTTVPTTTTTTQTTVTTTETTVTTTTTTTRIDGIDISVYQGIVDFQKVKAESTNQFIIIRAGYGRELSQEDIRFKTNYSGATAAGIPVGAYWYSYATSPETARIEANVCAQVLGDRKFEYPIVFDIEEPNVLAMTPEQIGAIIDAFCSEMESKGYYVMVYCSSYYLNNKIPRSITQRYDVWVAHYNVAQPTYTGSYGIWQYGIGSCPGIEGDVDVDYGYRDYTSVIKEKHLNGY